MLSPASSIEDSVLDSNASGIFICPQKFPSGVGNRHI